MQKGRIGSREDGVSGNCPTMGPLEASSPGTLLISRQTRKAMDVDNVTQIDHLMRDTSQMP